VTFTDFKILFYLLMARRRRTSVYNATECNKNKKLMPYFVKFLVSSNEFLNSRSLDYFNLHNPSSRTMALVSTQPLTEESTRYLPGGVKGDRRVRLTTLPPSVSRLSNVGA
jgi:hypothetical protein